MATQTQVLLFSLFAWLVFATPSWSQPGPTGRIAGSIIDAFNALPLPGATVEVVGAGSIVQTELDGKFSLELPPGEYVVKISLSGFQDRTIRVKVEPHRIGHVDVALNLASFAEEVTVVGTAVDAETSTAAAQLAERRHAPVITDNLGAQEMRANADTNAAAGLQRVTGLSVVDSRYVYVRGLGERYSNTTLGGAILPSTEPERRVVPLDIFPSGLLDNVSIVKSYSPDRPAEFAGGLVDVVPTKLPNRPVLDFSYRVGGNSLTLGQSVLDHPAGRRDWLGLRNGARRLPPTIPGRRVIRGGIYTPELGFTRRQLETFGELLENVWEPRVVDGQPNQGWSAAFGNRWRKFGLVASLTHSYGNEYQEEIQNYYRTEGGRLTPFSEYTYTVGANKATLAGIVSLTQQLGLNHRLSFLGLSIDRGRRETRTFEGFNSDAGRNLRNARLLWQEESLRTGQLAGEHFFEGLGKSRLDWRVSVSASDRDEPDLRETLYEEIRGRFQLADESQSGLRMFNDLDEDARDFSANWSAFFANWAGLPTMVKFGPYYSHRERQFSSRRFRFVPISTRGLDLTQRPELLFAPENIGPRFELREETRATDFYGAQQTVAAGYGMIDLLLSNTWRVVGGVRVEKFEQIVDTFDLFDVDVDDEVETIRGTIDTTDLFPSLNLVYAVRSDQNLRVGLSQTVNRPEFRELAPFEFTDIVGGRAVLGNAGLQRTLIQNYDVRWEWFRGAEEVIAISFFLKNFDKPIERFVEPTAQLRTSFTNARSARNVGVELEARKWLSRYALVGANYTFVDSEIELKPGQTNVLTSLKRPLAGTSRHILNGTLDLRLRGTSARLLFNYVDDRIADVGSVGLPDIIERGRPTVDFVLSQRVGRLNLRFAAENLTNESFRFEQSDQLQREFRIGRTFSVHFGFATF